MITKRDQVRRAAPADGTIAEVIRLALSDNFERIPFTTEGGYIATDISETGSEEDMHITICGYKPQGCPMYQSVTVIYFETMAQANRFRRSPEGQLFDDPYGDGQDNFEYTTFAGDSRLQDIIVNILKNHFGLRDTSHLVTDTHCEVDYFRKDPDNAASYQLKS